MGKVSFWRGEQGRSLLQLSFQLSCAGKELGRLEEQMSFEVEGRADKDARTEKKLAYWKYWKMTGVTGAQRLGKKRTRGITGRINRGQMMYAV
jgi:hypothetical protein